MENNPFSDTEITARLTRVRAALVGGRAAS
jgi:hypothetical protein